jgi:magnesium-transporting ATPase (P-type)
MTNVVPVSLLVTLELVHFFQGYFMQNDYDMYDEKQKYFMKCNTTNINEELGQVEYIFSDKTGTLTCNIMEFMKFSSRENAYYAKSEHTASDQTTSKQPKESGSSAQNKTAINGDAQEAHEFQNQGSDDLIYFEKTKQMIMDQKSEESHELFNTLLHISLCHSVVIDERKKNKLPDVKKSLDEKVEKARKGTDKDFLKKMEALRAEKLDELEKGVYNSASPDEIALILGAKLYGFEFTGLDGDNVLHVMDPLGKEQKFKLLNTLEFNSARKRMSVIIENVETQEIKLLTKGADSVVEPYISQDSSDEKKRVENVYKIINKNAAEGLRTLVLTEKVLSKSEWEDFNRRFNDA